MDGVYFNLEERIIDDFLERQDQPRQRILIALAGPPGSGKTTLAHAVAAHLTDQTDGPAAPIRAMVISMDGFLLPLSTLRAMPNADEALAKRGAPWTFDVPAVVALVRQLREVTEGPVAVPTFDDATNDLVPGGLLVTPDVNVCILDGRYLLDNEGPWSEITRAPEHDAPGHARGHGLVDRRWLMYVHQDLAGIRLLRRHLETGIETEVEAAVARVQDIDLPNGNYFPFQTWDRADMHIRSMADPSEGLPMFGVEYSAETVDDPVETVDDPAETVEGLAEGVEDPAEGVGDQADTALISYQTLLEPASIATTYPAYIGGDRLAVGTVVVQIVVVLLVIGLLFKVAAIRMVSV